MKNLVILAALLIICPNVRAQKQEVKKAQQAVNSGDYSRAATYLLQAKQIFAAADEKTRALYYIVEAEMNMASKAMDMEQLKSISTSLNTAKKYDKAKTYAARISEMELNLKNLSAKVAMGEFSKNNFSEAAILYNVAYQSSRDTLHFFSAAQSHLQANEYSQAFEAFRKLFYMGFTNAKIRHVATNSTTGKKEAFSSTAARELAIKKGTHKNAEVVHVGSKLPMILRGLTIASIELNKENEAIIAIDKTLAEAPNDRRLLNHALHLYIQLDAKFRYQKIMNQLIKETPNDPNLHYNFGVSSAQNNDTQRAKAFYKKALSLDSNHTNAKINLTLLFLDQEQQIIDKMNGLGDLNTEDQRYAELREELTKLYNELLPYLESVAAIEPQNKEWSNKLKNIHLFESQKNKMITAEEKIDD